MSEYKDLGVALKAYRVAANETISDLSDAIELDSLTLERIEDGTVRPKPEIIEMIARHFTLREQEASRLLELAGYNDKKMKIDLDSGFKDLSGLEKDIDILVTPIFYTDTINVTTNKFGVVMNFIQSNGVDGKPIVISRIGMSHQHANSVLDVLNKSLGRFKEENKGKNSPDS